MANSYGFPRIMSSYNFTSDDEGPPHNADLSTKHVRINPDGSCRDGWVCEHRWTPVSGMASFARATSGEDRTNWWMKGNQVGLAIQLFGKRANNINPLTNELQVLC